jgi:hypothetical protein
MSRLAPVLATERLFYLLHAALLPPELLPSSNSTDEKGLAALYQKAVHSAVAGIASAKLEAGIAPVASPLSLVASHPAIGAPALAALAACVCSVYASGWAPHPLTGVALAVLLQQQQQQQLGQRRGQQQDRHVTAPGSAAPAAADEVTDSLAPVRVAVWTSLADGRAAHQLVIPLAAASLAPPTLDASHDPTEAAFLGPERDPEVLRALEACVASVPSHTHTHASVSVESNGEKEGAGRIGSGSFTAHRLAKQVRLLCQIFTTGIAITSINVCSYCLKPTASNS